MIFPGQNPIFKSLNGSGQSDRASEFSEDGFLPGKAFLEREYGGIVDEMSGAARFTAGGQGVVAIDHAGDLQSANFRSALATTPGAVTAIAKGPCDRVVASGLYTMNGGSVGIKRFESPGDSQGESTAP